MRFINNLRNKRIDGIFANHYDYSDTILYIRYIKDHLTCYLYALWFRFCLIEVINNLFVWICLVFTTQFMLIFDPLSYLIYTMSSMVLYSIRSRMVEGFKIDKMVVPVNTIKTRRIDRRDSLKYTVIVGEWKGRRPYMEDRILEVAERNIYGVFDGHGGSDVSEFLVANFEHIYERFPKMGSHKQYQNLDRIEEEANVLYSTFKELENLVKSFRLRGGSTGIVVKLDPDYLITCSLGDSEAVMFDSRGRIVPLSSPHSFSRFDEYSRYIKDSEKIGRYIRKSNVIRTYTGLMPTRSFGDFRHKARDSALLSDPEVKVVRLDGETDWEIVVIGSDGIFDCLNMRKIVDEIIRAKIMIVGEDGYTVYDFSKSKVDILMKRLQEITTKLPDTHDKLHNIYGGDNCSICIIVKNVLGTGWDVEIDHDPSVSNTFDLSDSSSSNSSDSDNVDELDEEDSDDVDDLFADIDSILKILAKSK